MTNQSALRYAICIELCNYFNKNVRPSVSLYNVLMIYLEFILFDHYTVKRDNSRFNPFYSQISSLLLGKKYLFKHQNLQMFGLKLNKRV